MKLARVCRSALTSSSVALAALALAGCAGPPESDREDVGASESAVTGVDAVTGIEEGSAVARAVLRAASELSAEELGYCAGVRSCPVLDRAYLHPKAREAIVALRATGPVQSLAELRSAIAAARPGVVDSFSFQSLFAVAAYRGWLDGLDLERGAAVTPSSADASAIVRAANELGESALRFGPVAEEQSFLDWPIASAVAARRARAPFASFDELVAVAFADGVLARVATAPSDRARVRAYTLAQLLRVAHAKGWAAPEAPAWLSGWPAWSDDRRLLATFAKSSSTPTQWACWVSTKSMEIACGDRPSSPGGYALVRAQVGDDGSFDSSTGCGSRVQGALLPGGLVRLDTMIYAECVGSGKKEATGLGTAKVVPQCWHDGITFPSGAWVEGQWKPCAP